MYLDFFSIPMDPHAVVALSAAVGAAGIGVAIAYLVGDPRSPATRALAFAVAIVGIANAAYPAQHVLHPDGRDIHWLVGLPILDAVIMGALFVWMLQVAKAAQPTARALSWIRACAALFALVTACYLMLGWLYPTERMTHFLFCLEREWGCATAEFAIFFLPVVLMGSLMVAAGVILYTQRIDAAERVRVVTVAIATPFFFSTYILPAGYNVMMSLPGLLIFLIGGMRYHTIKGERGQFMTRFLSPEVARLVNTRGLSYTMQPRKLELSVVCCDLRGFTSFSRLHDSDQVTRLLAEYYDGVGKVVAHFGATIKDYAGDGILILVGAPLPITQHARQSLAIARGIRMMSRQLIRQWASTDTPLGIGIGVASGVVTVGAIGSSSRMEYTAVGPAVNLASRLCAQAQDGEVLVDGRTAALAGQDGLQARGTLAVKGMGEVLHYACVAA